MAKIWLDAAEFSEKGDWRVETQFVRETGQGYLLAVNVPGYPAADAKTEFNVSEAGAYRVWVRTRNWLREHGPGRFRALIDGERIGNEMGNLPSERWGWQIAGDMQLTAGAHELAMRDTTGYFPRFSSVLLTDDMDYTPSPEWERIRAERARILGETDGIARTEAFDVAVAGAGPGGIPAAVAAARSGKKVVLIHSRPILGGNASDEANVGFDGAYIRHPGMREGGIAEEIRRIRDSKDISFFQALEILCANTENLTIVRNHCVIDVEMDGDRIAAAVAVDTFTGKRCAFPAKMFIDATGDGWLGYYAGAAHRVGREALWQHGEAHAPRYADNRTMSGCLMGSKGLIKTPINYARDCGDMLSYYAIDIGEPAPFHAPKWAQILPEKLHRSPNRLHTGEWWIENPTDFDDLFEAEMTRDHLMLISLAYFDWLKNHYEKRDLVTNFKIIGFPTFDAKRESRRLIGDYILKEQDCVSGRVFDDAVAYAGWSIDVHNQDGIFSGLAGPYDFDLPVPVSTVPYRCLYSKNIENLLMSGRCISVTHVALGTVRVENTLATIGQAAGTAAAMSLDMDITPRELGEKYIRALQQRLLRDDLYIPGCCNEDDNDFARKAAITATSFSTVERFSKERGIPGGFVPLDETYAMIFRRVPENPVEIYMRNSGPETIINCEWVEISGSVDVQDVIGTFTATVPAGFEGYVPTPRCAEVKAGVIGLRLLANPAVEVQRIEVADHPYQLAKYRAPYWPVERNTTLMHRLTGVKENPLADCSPQAVVNGISRPVSPELYGWVSDSAQELPQEIRLAFDEPTDIGLLQIVFDTDLKNPLFSYQWVTTVRELVRDYEVLVDGVVVDAVKDNQYRLRRHAINAKNAKEITVRALSTWGDPSARIFEIRAYR